jgi:hypothetical protein
MWLRRYENGENFSDRSHQTFGVAANKTPKSVENLIVEARRKEPAIGAVKIKRMLENQGETCLCADAKENEQFGGVKDSLEKTFDEFGKPKILLCDNGSPWGTSQTTGFTHFEIWLMEHGILTVHIRPKHPQSQGKVEKFNGSFKRERLKFYTPADMDDAQAQRLEYRGFYNNTRPHHALKLDTPSKHYEPSPRKYSRTVSDWEYDTGSLVRKIKDTGYFNYKGQGYYLSEGFRGKTIAIMPSETRENAVNICFREFQIGIIDLDERAIISRKARILKSDKPSDTAA